jgi:hypothetical protein
VSKQGGTPRSSISTVTGLVVAAVIAWSIRRGDSHDEDVIQRHIDVDEDERGRAAGICR